MTDFQVGFTRSGNPDLRGRGCVSRIVSPFRLRHIGWCVVGFLALMLAGCEPVGKSQATWRENTTTTYRADGSTDSVTTNKEFSSQSSQPNNGTEPATASAGPTGSSSSSGAQQEQTAAMIAAGKAWISYVVGGALALAGVGLLVMKKWLPMLPTTAGVYTMLAGGGVIILATISATIPWWAWLIVAAAGALLVLPGVIANMKEQKQWIWNSTSSTSS